MFLSTTVDIGENTEFLRSFFDLFTTITQNVKEHLPSFMNSQIQHNLKQTIPFCITNFSTFKQNEAILVIYFQELPL